jgi:hypothetical protein
VLTDLLRRWREAFPPSGPPASATPEDGADSVLVDPLTQTWWSPSAGTTATLVEAAEPAGEAESVGRRVAALLAARDAPAGPSRAPWESPARRPAGDPARHEEHLVELLRQGSYELAFAQLAAPCQRRWGSPDAFAAAQGASAANLLGVSVRGTRYLSCWTDTDAGCVHRDVAELEVEYRVRLSPATAATVVRTVHLVPAAGGWRSVCYPQGGTAG